MNLNKYDSQGFPYTAEEAAQRANAIFGTRYLHRTDDHFPPKPYNVGRNAAKRAARQSRGIRK